VANGVQSDIFSGPLYLLVLDKKCVLLGSRVARYGTDGGTW